MGARDARVGIGKKRNFAAQKFEVQEFGFAGVVEVGRVVGDLVHPVDELGLDRRTQVQQIFGELRKRYGVVVAGMLDDALSDLKGQIEAGKFQVAMLELLHDTKRVEVVVEPGALRTHNVVQLALPGVAKGRMSNV